MFSGYKDVDKKKDFVGKTQDARNQRAEEKRREHAIVKIQVKLFRPKNGVRSFAGYRRTSVRNFRDDNKKTSGSCVIYRRS